MKTTINAKQLKHALLATLDAASTDQARPALTMVQIEAGRNQLIITAADRYILSTTTLDAPGLTGPTPTAKNPREADFFYHSLYSAKTAEAMIKALPAKPAGLIVDIEIDSDTNAISILGKQYTRSEEQPTYPDYRQVTDGYKRRKTNGISVDATEIQPGIAAIAKIARAWTVKKGKKIEYLPATRLYVNGRIVLITNSQDGDSARWDIPANAANDFMCFINAEYLHNVIKHAAGKTKIIYSTWMAPLDIFYENTHSVIMPMSGPTEFYDPIAPEIITPAAARSEIYRPRTYKADETQTDREEYSRNVFPHEITRDIFHSQPAEYATEYTIDTIENTIITPEKPSELDKYAQAGHEHERAQINMTGISRTIQPTPAEPAADPEPQPAEIIAARLLNSEDKHYHNILQAAKTEIDELTTPTAAGTLPTEPATICASDTKTPILAPQATQPEPITDLAPEERNLPTTTQPAPDQAPDQAPQPAHALDTYEAERAAILKKYRWIDRTDPKYKSTVHNGRINLRNELAALDARHAAINVTAEFSTIPAMVTA